MRYLAPVAFLPDGTRAVGASSFIPWLPEKCRIEWPADPPPVEEVGKDTPDAWATRTVVALPPDGALDPEAVTGVLSQARDSVALTYASVRRVVPDADAPPEWPRITLAEIPAKFWGDYEVIWQGKAAVGRYYPPSFRAVVETNSKVPSSWAEES